MGSRYDKEELKHKVKLRKIERNGERILRKQELKAKKDSYKKPRKKIQTSKLILWSMIILVLEIVLFVEFAMIKWGDFSAMYALIGIPATLIPVIWAYYSKSKAENTQGGITYETAMKNYETENNTDAVG